MSAARQGLLLVLLSLGAAGAGFWAARAWFMGDQVRIGEPAPVIGLVDLSGQPRSLEEFRGKLVLVNFWASWCAPCVAEIPLLVEAQARYGAQGLQVLGPALDEPQGVAPFVGRFRINYPVMADYASADAASRALGNLHGALPYSVLISRDGLILKTILGGLQRDELDELIADNLGV